MFSSGISSSGTSLGGSSVCTGLTPIAGTQPGVRCSWAECARSPSRLGQTCSRCAGRGGKAPSAAWASAFPASAGSRWPMPQGQQPTRLSPEPEREAAQGQTFATLEKPQGDPPSGLGFLRQGEHAARFLGSVPQGLPTSRVGLSGFPSSALGSWPSRSLCLTLLGLTAAHAAAPLPSQPLRSGLCLTRPAPPR